LLKFKNKKGETIFRIQDDDAKPKRVEDVCLRCQQGGDIPNFDPLGSTVVCLKCGRSIEVEEEE
jgi:hypothetical protein